MKTKATNWLLWIIVIIAFCIVGGGPVISLLFGVAVTIPVLLVYFLPIIIAFVIFDWIVNR